MSILIDAEEATTLKCSSSALTPELFSEYRDLNAQLSALPALDLTRWPNIHIGIRAALAILNTAMEANDLKTFLSAKTRILSLYIHAVALAAPRGLAVKIYSVKLNTHVWLVPDESEANALRAASAGQLDAGAIYTYAEIASLSGAKDMLLERVHDAKLTLQVLDPYNVSSLVGNAAVGNRSASKPVVANRAGNPVAEKTAYQPFLL